MQAGWIKLHRKALNNPIRKKDPHAWYLFETLLLLVDSQTGTWEGGRFQLAQLCGFKDTTTYARLRRLKAAKMVTLVSNNKFTTISICKWGEYQGLNDNKNDTKHDNKMTTNGQQNDTLTRSKELENKESIVITNVINNTSVTTQFGNAEVNELWTLFEQNIYPITSKQRLNRYALSNLLKKYGKEKVISLINAAAASNEDRYGPRIATPLQLQDKLSDLAIWAKKQDKGKVTIIS